MLKTGTGGTTPKAMKRPLDARRKRELAEEHNWDQKLGFLMHDVSRLRRLVFDNFMKPLEVTRSQWWVLAFLSRHDGMIQSDLASTLELGKAALGGLIDRLEDSAFVQRRTDTMDRRVKRIYLTAKGNQTVEAMRVMNHDMNEQVLVGLSHEQRLSLAKLMKQVKQNLSTIKHESGLDD